MTAPVVEHWVDHARAMATPRRLAVVIITAAVVAAAAAGWDNSATNDEPYHTLAAFTYVHDGRGDLNVEHPPLAKLVAGVALLPLGLSGSSSAPVQRLLVLSQEVRRFIYGNTIPAPVILRAARLPMLTFLAFLLAGAYAWARWAFGERTAVLAVLALACQPLVLGHAFVVHTDVPAAAAWTWALYLLHRWLAGWARGWLPFGLVLGLALIIKFTCVYLLPVATLAAAVVAVRTRRPAVLLALAGGGAVALAVVWAGVGVAIRGSSLAEERATIDLVLGLWPGTEELARRLQALAGASRPLAHYALGLAYVWETNLHGQGINFFVGSTSARGFLWYFPVALVLKSSLPFLVMAVLGTVAAIRRKARTDLLMLAAAAYYLLISLGASYNIGARHLMPILPLLAIVGAHQAEGWQRRVRVLLVLAFLTSAGVSFPHYIAHFNLAAGGARAGHRYLNDSNLDWGQDWTRLGREAERRGWRPLAYVYLGAGNPASDLPGAADALALPGPPGTGYVAVSSYAAAVGVQYLEALRHPREAAKLAEILALVRQRGEPVGDVGHTITAYRIRPPI